MGLSQQVPLKDMSKIGVMFLGVENTQIELFKERCREDVEAVNYKILEHWRDRHPEPESRNELYQLLSKAGDKGLIQKTVIQFLQSPPEIQKSMSISVT